VTRKLIMLRHGQTEYNASGRMQGQMDTKLSDVGIRQAEAVARYMKGVNIGYVVSSDLSRAAETGISVMARSIGEERDDVHRATWCASRPVILLRVEARRQHSASSSHPCGSL